MKKCAQCQQRADFICLSCGVLFCYADVFTTQIAFRSGCTQAEHMFVPIIQKELFYMAIATEKDATAEGKKVGMALFALFGSAAAQVDIGAANFLARKFAKYEGLTNMDLNYAFVDGFIQGCTAAEQKKIDGPRESSDAEA